MKCLTIRLEPGSHLSSECILVSRTQSEILLVPAPSLPTVHRLHPLPLVELLIDDVACFYRLVSSISCKPLAGIASVRFNWPLVVISDERTCWVGELIRGVTALVLAVIGFPLAEMSRLPPGGLLMVAV